MRTLQIFGGVQLIYAHELSHAQFNHQKHQTHTHNTADEN